MEKLLQSVGVNPIREFGDDPVSAKSMKDSGCDIVFASIRPPWDWYTSYYHFAMARPGGDTWIKPHLEQFGDNPEILYGLVDPAIYGVGKVKDFGFVITSMDIESGQGLWSCVVKQILGENADQADWLMDMYKLNEGVSELFNLLEIDAELIPPVNAFHGGIKSQEMPSDWWELVQGRDRTLSARLGYRADIKSRKVISNRPVLEMR